MGSVRKETREAMEMLFRAKWNLCQAATHANLTLKETKLAFAGWCESHPPTFVEETTTQLFLF